MTGLNAHNVSFQRIWERLFARPRIESADNTEMNFSDVRCTTVVCVLSAEDRNQ